MAAIISGSTLSMLFYDHSSTLGNQEGLLTGKVISHVKDTISDSQINNVKVETKIYIYGCTCQSRFEPFHDNKGNILNIDKSAVGWYRYRHNTSHRLSMKEKSLHQCLLKNVPPDKQDNFIFILCTSQKSENLSTCNFDYTVFKYDARDKKYLIVPMTVINLGDTTHREYKCTKSCTVDYESGVVGSLLSTFEHELLGSGNSEAVGVQRMAESLQTQLQCLTHGVMQSDQELHELHSELAQMELRLQKKMEKQRAMKPLPPSPTSADSHPLTAKAKMSSEEAVARLKREQRRNEQQKSLYPNLSDLKVASSGSRTRRLSEDNYLNDLNNGKTTLHTQMDQKCHILDSPIETAEESPSLEMTQLVRNCVKNTTEEISDQIKPNHDKHVDIPFADSEGFDHTVNKRAHEQKDTCSTKIKNDTSGNKCKNSDPFAFVEGMLANSKSGSEISRKKVNYDSGEEVKSTKPHLTESGRVTRSRNSQPIGMKQSNKESSIQQGQTKKPAQRSRSREKEHVGVQKKLDGSRHRSPEIDISGTVSDEDIFNTKDENEENLNHVIDISASPVF